MKKLLRIAVDGPGGAGKSTVAKIIASRFGIDYIDTGAMYRAIACRILSSGTECAEGEALDALLADTEVDYRAGRVFLDGRDASDLIRTEEISMLASRCSALPAVRKKLVALQRAMASDRSLVMDGRDIGTNVICDAEFKFFVTATPEERARRRWLELKEKGPDPDYDEVLEDIRRRDHADSHRALDPLKKADDAVEIDTTHMSIEEVAGYMEKIIRFGI